MTVIKQLFSLISAYIILNEILSLREFTVAAVPQNYTNDLLRMAKALQMKTFVNEERAPCDNFYKFACGNWPLINPAPFKGKTTYLDQLQDLFWRKSVEMLKSLGRSDTSTDIKLKSFYESCRSTGKLDKNGLEAIFRVVDFKGGWPVVTNYQWYEYEYDWLKVVANVRSKLGLNLIIGLNIVPDFQDKDIHRIMVGAPPLDFSREIYIETDEDKENIRNAYTYSIKIQLQRYFPEMSEEWASEVAQQILHVEKNLAVGLPLNKALNVQQTTRFRYISELKAAYGNYVDLNRYFNLIFNETIYSQVYETPEDYMANLVDVIKLTPKLTIANYTMWKVLQHFDLNTAMLNKSEKWCVDRVIEYFPDAVKSMYARNYQTIEVVNQLQSVWSDIKRTFRDMLLNSPNLSWIGIDTRQRASEKLEYMALNLPLSSSEYIPELDKLRLNRHNYYANFINILHWQTIQNLAKLVEKPNERKEEILLPEYIFELNKIKIPLTFLQSRFFWDSSYPHALLYSTLGFLLAQQMLKGFDSQGRKYDKYGQQRPWMDHTSEYGFDDRSNCFVKQYSKYEFPGWLMKNEKTLKNTYVADNGALAIAYRAYQQWWTNMANTELAAQEKLPVLDSYTQNQLFFLGFAQLWCADYNANLPEYHELPEYWRVIGTLANFNAFAQEFQCDVGNKMNPEQKCILY